jgi:cathepsin B
LIISSPPLKLVSANWENSTALYETSPVKTKPEQIQTEIMTNGPVEAAFSVYEDFLAYKSGVYKYTSGDFLELFSNNSKMLLLFSS